MLQVQENGALLQLMLGGRKATRKVLFFPSSTWWEVSDKENFKDDYSDDEYDTLPDDHNTNKLEVLEEENHDDEDLEDDENDEDASTGYRDDDEYKGFASIQKNLHCSMQDKPTIPRSWILLDSQPTIDIFSNEKLINNICDMKQNLHCNSGKTLVTQKRWSVGLWYGMVRYGTVCYGMVPYHWNS